MADKDKQRDKPEHDDDMDAMSPAERAAHERVADADMPDALLPVAPTDPPTTLTPQYDATPQPVGPGSHVGAYPQDPAVIAEAIAEADEATADQAKADAKADAKAERASHTSKPRASKPKDDPKPADKAETKPEAHSTFDPFGWKPTTDKPADAPKKD